MARSNPVPKSFPVSLRAPLLAALLVTLSFLLPASVSAEAPKAAMAAFDTYAQGVETRLATQHQTQDQFLAPADKSRLKAGELLIEKVTPSNTDTPGAMLHHWRGTAFAPGATAADLDRILRDFASYPQTYTPEVVRSSVQSQDGDHYTVAMRVRQKHVITVVMETTYDVLFQPLDGGRGSSTSASTQVSEIAAPGTPQERVLPPAEDHGFLWRLNTYWTYAEGDGGLYLQVESISLTRSIPAGLAWAVGPFVESVPRDSLEFTLHRTCDALKQPTPKGTR